VVSQPQQRWLPLLPRLAVGGVVEAGGRSPE
jgi:hypothetical protein